MHFFNISLFHPSRAFIWALYAEFWWRIPIPRLYLTWLKSSRLESSQIKSTRVKSSQLESNWLESTWLESTWLELTWLELTWLNWVNLTWLESTWLDSTRVDLTWLESLFLSVSFFGNNSKSFRSTSKIFTDPYSTRRELSFELWLSSVHWFWRWRWQWRWQIPVPRVLLCRNKN